MPRSRSNGYPNEAAFQTDAVRHLAELDWCVQESLKGSSGNGAVYYTPGWPDLQVYRLDGQRRLWFAELKQPGNRPDDAQLACHARLRAAGFTVIVAWTLQDVLHTELQERAR